MLMYECALGVLALSDIIVYLTFQLSEVFQMLAGTSGSRDTRTQA